MQVSSMAERFDVTLPAGIAREHLHVTACPWLPEPSLHREIWISTLVYEDLPDDFADGPTSGELEWLQSLPQLYAKSLQLLFRKTFALRNLDGKTSNREPVSCQTQGC